MINTEAQMKAVKDEIMEDLEADAELLGVKKKAKQADAGGGAAGGSGGDGGAGASGSGDGGSAAEEMVGGWLGEGGHTRACSPVACCMRVIPASFIPSSYPPCPRAPLPLDILDTHQVPVQVDEQQLKELTEMGFGEARAARALHCSGGGGVEAAVAWLAEHEGDADLDEPLLVPKVSNLGLPVTGGGRGG